MRCYGVACKNMAGSTKFSQEDWKTSNFLVSSSAERQRAAAHTIRQENHKLSNHTGKKHWAKVTANHGLFLVTVIWITLSPLFRECDAMDTA